jgi:hypothetical protein
MGHRSRIALLIAAAVFLWPSQAIPQMTLPQILPFWRQYLPEPPKAVQGVPEEGIRLSDEEALSVGMRIWKNESGGTRSGLTHWNTGEDFASLGIGHFIWYPKGRRGPFTESFRNLLAYLEPRYGLPKWLKGQPACPWPTGREFYGDFQSARMRSLRAMLEATVGLQARFAADRLEAALPKILETLPVAQREPVRLSFYRVAAHPTGVYALVDYVNFKGEGVSPTERYKGQGWGLLQVLEGMDPARPALHAFAESADVVLTRRVANSPAERREERWLKGWRKRLLTYRGD